MTITALPTPPSRSDPANFSVRADAFLGALPSFGVQANALQIDVNSKQVAATSSANAAAVSAGNANTSAINSAASAASAAASAGVTAWNPATNYSTGTNVYDTTDFLTYRRRVAGTTTNRPGIDPTNWELIAGNVTLQTAQTITAIKTFTQRIVGDITGNAGTADALTNNTVLCPTGMVGHFVNTTAPAGWLKANGALVSRSTYSGLFSVLGTTYGVGDGVTTFALPDLRGEFLRAWDDGRGVDPSRALNTSQADEFKSHTHAFLGNNANGRFTANGSPGMHADIGNTTSATGGTETRPRNIALLACIKF